MPIKLIALNVEGGKHLKRILPFLKKERADILCLQEVFKVDLPRFKKELGMEGRFFPNGNKLRSKDEPGGFKGICFLTKLRHSVINAYYYVGDGKVKKITSYSKNRALIYTKVKDKKDEYMIGNTHFTWTPDGQADQRQRRDFKKLMSFVKKFDNFILVGDFNAPRGREIFTAFTKYFKDGLPKNIKSTIDPKLHKRSPDLKYVVDTIFYRGNYKVNQVRAVAGVSDHKAVVGVIENI